MRKNKISKENQMKTDLTNLLQGELSETERKILSDGLIMLEKKEYFPKITLSLRSDLTPLATHHELSKEVGDFYLKLIGDKYADKGFGRGLISVFGQISGN